MHAFICECSRKGCREKIYLAPTRYERLSRRGMLISQECSWRHDRTVVERFPGGVVVQASNAGKNLLRAPAMGAL